MRSSIIDENREVDLNDDSPKITPDAGPKMTSSTPPIGMKSLNCYVIQSAFHSGVKCEESSI